ncbi:MAG: hypothetical protein NVV82_11160 [Sporocytophaga sp.]|nr:hypothetical protein [Sporocytophaga sp.]
MSEIREANINKFPIGNKLMALFNQNSTLESFIKKDLSILDLGFYEPSNFIYLNYTYPISEYMGIDLKEEIIYIPRPDDIVIPEDLVPGTVEEKFPFNRYLVFHKYYGMGEPLNKNKFENTFKFIYIDALNYLTELPSHKKFSLIVIRDLLHLLDRRKATEILDKALQHIKTDGLIYLQFYIEEQYRSKKINPYSLEESESILMKFSKIHLKEISNGKMTILGEK